VLPCTARGAVPGRRRCRVTDGARIAARIIPYRRLALTLTGVAGGTDPAAVRSSQSQLPAAAAAGRARLRPREHQYCCGDLTSSRSPLPPSPRAKSLGSSESDTRARRRHRSPGSRAPGAVLCGCAAPSKPREVRDEMVEHVHVHVFAHGCVVRGHPSVPPWNFGNGA
jgi:hypothetical protein